MGVMGILEVIRRRMGIPETSKQWSCSEWVGLTLIVHFTNTKPQREADMLVKLFIGQALAKLNQRLGMVAVKVQNPGFRNKK